MKSYRIVYRETLVHVFYVDAENEDEAKEVFKQDLMDGKVDFSDGEVEDTKCEFEEFSDYTPSAENGDYSPSNPWDAPGMSEKDFI